MLSTGTVLVTESNLFNVLKSLILFCTNNRGDKATQEKKSNPCAPVVHGG